jgi:hypothetical protein
VVSFTSCPAARLRFMIICARGALSLDLHGHAGLSPRAMWTRKSYLTSCSSCRIKLAELVNEPWTWSAPGTVFDTLVIDAFRASEAEPPRATAYAEAVNRRIRLAATGPLSRDRPGLHV